LRERIAIREAREREWAEAARKAAEKPADELKPRSR
jgi:hypothetical protein